MFNTGEKLRVRNSIIRGADGPACGILFTPNTNAEIQVQDSIISENGTSGNGGGVCVVPRGNADVVGVFDGLTSENNRYGVRVNAPANRPTSILIQNSVISGDTVGLSSNGAGSTLRLSNTSIFGNTTGLQDVNGGSLITLGGNMLRGNGTNGSFTGSEAKQ